MSKIVLIYGLSGSGKSLSARLLEDAGVRVVRNMPTGLLAERAKEIAGVRHGRPLVIFPELSCEEDRLNTEKAVDQLTKAGEQVFQLFLHASDDILLNRYRETRRPHPFAVNGSVLDSIKREREILEPLKVRSRFAINTDSLDSRQLQEELFSCLQISDTQKTKVTFLSFGFKYGLASQADLCFDVRFLRNPYFEADLKEKSGKDEAVKDFVLGQDAASIFLVKLKDLLSFLIPLYGSEGKSYLTIAIGCTGGRHRSVAITEEIFNTLQIAGANKYLVHRDIEKV